MRAPRLHPVGLAVQKRRVREQRGRHRLQRQAHAQLLDHVRLGPEVEVHLHRAGPVHHLRAERADLFHVGRHQRVAPLGHHRHVRLRPLGRGAKADEARADLVGDLPHLGQVRVHLVAGLVDGFQRRARQLELPAGFKADVGAVAFQPDQVVAFQHLLPAEAVAQAFQHRLDRAFAVVGQGLQIVPGKAELLVFGADAPVLGRLLAGCDVVGKLLAPLDRAAALLGNGHDASRGVAADRWLAARP